MLHRASADDGAGHAGAILDPFECDLGRRRVDLFADLDHGIDDGVGLFGEVARVGLVATFAFFGSLLACVLAAEDAAFERAPGADTHAKLFGHLDELAFECALDQRVFKLDGGDRRPVFELCEHMGLRCLPRGCVRKTDVADLAGADEVVKGSHGFFDGCVLVPEVHPVEIDVVRSQAAEGLLACGDDAFAACAAAVWVGCVHVAAELGCDDDAIALVAILAEVIAEDFLGVAFVVDVGRVDEVAACIEVGIYEVVGILGSRPKAPFLAESHGTHAQGGDAEA